MPAVRAQVARLFGREPYKAGDVEGAVARGAAFLAAAATGEIRLEILDALEPSTDATAGAGWGQPVPPPAFTPTPDLILETPSFSAEPGSVSAASPDASAEAVPEMVSDEPTTQDPAVPPAETEFARDLRPAPRRVRPGARGAHHHAPTQCRRRGGCPCRASLAAGAGCGARSRGLAQPCAPACPVAIGPGREPPRHAAGFGARTPDGVVAEPAHSAFGGRLQNPRTAQDMAALRWAGRCACNRPCPPGALAGHRPASAAEWDSQADLPIHPRQHRHPSRRGGW